MKETASATKLLTIKGKEKLFNSFKKYIETVAAFEARRMPKEQLETAEKEFKLIIMDLEWRLE